MSRAAPGPPSFTRRSQYRDVIFFSELDAFYPRLYEEECTWATGSKARGNKRISGKDILNPAGGGNRETDTRCHQGPASYNYGQEGNRGVGARSDRIKLS